MRRTTCSLNREVDNSYTGHGHVKRLNRVIYFVSALFDDIHNIWFNLFTCTPAWEHKKKSNSVGWVIPTSTVVPAGMLPLLPT